MDREGDITYYGVMSPAFFDLQGAFLCTCSQGGFLDFKNEEYVVFYLLSRQGSAVSCSCCFGVSVHRGEVQLLSLGPICLLPEGVS